MPNDLGQPRKGKIRNNCRREHDISDYKSNRAMSRVRQVNSEPIKFTEVKEKVLEKAYNETAVFVSDRDIIGLV